MAKFIKVTTFVTGTKTWINIDKIIEFSLHKEHPNARICTERDSYVCKESDLEIERLIKEIDK